jgi:pSer/pThr/pTyr-binding forkhead associated (FHA) protein
MESISFEKTTSKLIYLMTPQDNKHAYRMGRGNDQDVRLTDISVSRQHAKIEFDYNKFTINDELSKFGTLIQI